MQAFEYAHPRSVTGALPLLGSRWGETEILAGGTDLLSLMKNYVVTPKRVVNIKGLRELSGIRATPAGIHIGALMTLEELRTSQPMHEYPALAQAAAGVTSPQICNMGTVGGDLCQRPRCWYFRSGFGLLARDESGRSLVPQGENRYHAILGKDGPAYFLNPSSLAPALIALGAKARLDGQNGERYVALAEFFVIPKSDAERENVLQPNEILTHVIIPEGAWELSSATYEVRQKEALDWPLATAAVALKMEAGQLGRATVPQWPRGPLPGTAPGAGKTPPRQAAYR